ncbi:dynein regulatory complex subunit 4-like [Larimichthys crocea]|uniref:dynein regulatory complex subunit 4-like n=1 Tax=Larimichthys crocea TaxID=215358 RepID=UPI000F5E98DF|nr:dynein regulatory complex subunit 4-like [Larimichthys crocea]XP_027133801.1 dynein regulatory complex subunit 4-like [Larimichthys crocea]
MSKEQLWEHALCLIEERDRLREEKIYFRQERDKAIASWEISKRKLAEEDAKLRNKQRAREEAQERHRVEIAEYKQKLKHMLSEHHDTASGLKMDGVASTSLIQNKHTESEIALQEELHDLEKDSMEKKLLNQKRIEQLKQKHQLDLMEMENHYKKKVREMEVEYHEKWQSMCEEAAKKRRAEIKELDDKMKSRVKDLLEEHDESLRKAKNHYYKIQDKHGHMKDYLLEIEKQKKLNADVAAVKEDIKRLREEVQKEEQKKTEIQNQLREMKRARGQAAMKRTPAKVIEKERRELLVKHELLLQACEKIEQERDDKLKKQRKAMLEIQQKNGLKELLLEKKIEAQTVILQKTQAELYAVLAAQGDSSAAAKLEELMESLQGEMRAADNELDQECKKYDYVLTMVKEKLKALGVPLFDFPFKTSAQILRELPPLKNSAASH